MRDPSISDILRFMAREASEEETTGWAVFGRVAVAYYPRLNRYTWFFDHKPTTKKEAVEWLTAPHLRGFAPLTEKSSRPE